MFCTNTFMGIHINLPGFHVDSLYSYIYVTVCLRHSKSIDLFPRICTKHHICLPLSSTEHLIKSTINKLIDCQVTTWQSVHFKKTLPYLHILSGLFANTFDGNFFSGFCVCCSLVCGHFKALWFLKSTVSFRLQW